jgi:hypothetical protein
MIHPDRHLREIVSSELGIMVHDIPEGRLYDVFMLLLDPFTMSRFKVAYILFLGVWYYG